MGKHTNSGLGGFMSGNSIRFSKMKSGMGGADAWRDSLQATAAANRGGAPRPRTSGTKLPKEHTIHTATVVCVKEYGAFVQLGDGGTYRDGMIHISQTSCYAEKVEDVLKEGQKLWVKVAEVTDDERWNDRKYQVDFRYVDQRNGKDLDPHNCKTHKMPDNHFQLLGRSSAAPSSSSSAKPAFGATLFSGSAA
jgi:predicted RNA-binding protein with RPS1 domain